MAIVILFIICCCEAFLLVLLIVSKEPGTNAEKFVSYLVKMPIAEFYAEKNEEKKMPNCLIKCLIA